jgi:PAS domain S-box-containing protein
MSPTRDAPRLTDLADPGSPLRVLLDSMAEGVSLSSQDGTIRYTNPAEDRMFGYDPGELWGRHVSVQNAYPPDENQRVVAAVIEELQRSGSWQGAWRNRRKDGSEFLTRSRISAVELEGETHWLCVQEDVTEEAAAAAALGRERARLRLATAAGGIGIWDWDLDADRIALSEEAAGILGLPAGEELWPERFLDLVHPEDRDRVTALSREALDPGLRSREPYEYRIHRPDGALRWVLARGEAIFGANGALRYLGTIQDITARRELEEGSARAAQRLRLAIDAGRMAVWDLDVATGTVTGSPELSRLLGFPEGEAIDADAARLRYLPGEYERVSAEGAAALARGETSHEAEFRYGHPELGALWLRLRYDVLFDREGRPRRVIGVISDETRRREAEAQLRASEEELRALAEAMPMLISFIDAEQRYRFMNRLHETWLGRPREELIGRTIREVLGDDAYLPRQSHIETALGGEATRLETFVPVAGGGRRDTEVHYLPRPGRDGGVEGLYAVVVDLTEQKAAQRALAQAREEAEREAARTAAILGQLAEGVIVTDTAGRITFVNEAAERLHGVAQLGVTPGRYSETYHLFTEDGRPYPAEELPLARAALRGETVEDARWRIRRPDGTEVLAVGSARPIRTPDGERIGAVLTLRDDTARASAEAELRRLNRDLEAEIVLRTAERDRIWQNSNEFMAVFGFDGRRRSVNPAWERLLGHDDETLLSTPFTDLTHPEDRPRLLEAVERLRQGERVVDFEDRLRHADGSWRTVSWTGVPGKDVFYAIGRDVTEQRQAEDALRQAQKMEAVGQLTGGIAHDFNNLLAGIVGSLDLLQSRLAQGRMGDLERYAGAAMASASRAAALTHRLLAFSRRQPLDPRPVEANRLVAGMEDLLRRTLGPAVSLEMVLAGGLWRTLCDPVQLESALLNLCINARDAMPEGGRLTIETANAHLDDAYAAAQRDVAPGQYVAVCVTDTGVGMSPELISRVFEPFFTTKPIGQGTGLGLSMVYGFAKQSEGHVRIYSEEGQGTTVKLYLPRHRGEAEAPDPGGAALEPPRAEAGETVLVVEDEPVVRGLIVEVLGDLGYRALEAADGPSGLRLLQSRRRIDLLITDVGLPGLNGRQLADQARERRPGLRVLFVTGYAENATLAHGFLEPGMAMLTKPFAVEALMRKIRELLADRSA